MIVELIHRAIRKINPKSEVGISGNDISAIDTIIWHNGTEPISKEQILAKIPEVEFDMALANLRQRRNNLLAQTDYLALSDQTMSAEMTTYRQALRDITNGLTTVEQVNAVVWPERPEV